MSVNSFLKELISVFITGIAFPGFNFQQKPGLYPIGAPSEKSPILITSNYFITVKRVISSLKNQKIDSWLLVVDTAGVNVWCSAAGGNFTAERILQQIEKVKLREKLSHKNLILPQLSAAGVNHIILKEAGWNARFGPVEIRDLGAYLKNNLEKSNKAKTKSFPFKERLELSIGHNFFISLILLPFVLLVELLRNPLPFLSPWAQWLVANILFLLFYIWMFGFLVAILYPFIPFKSGFLKGLILSIAIIPIVGFLLFSSSSLEFILAFGSLIIYGTAISTDFDGFTPLHGMDFFEKDLILFAGVALLVVVGLIIFPVVLT